MKIRTRKQLLEENAELMQIIEKDRKDYNELLTRFEDLGEKLWNERNFYAAKTPIIETYYKVKHVLESNNFGNLENQVNKVKSIMYEAEKRSTTQNK